MDTDEGLLQARDAGGVLPLLTLVAGFCTLERRSESIELHDLLKAIYIVDLEHVSEFWQDWKSFERLVSTREDDGSTAYINRTLYLVRLEAGSRETPGEFVSFGNASPLFTQVIAKARTLAAERTGSLHTPSSADVLLAMCLSDSNLSNTLQRAGLRLQQLKVAVAQTL